MIDIRRSIRLWITAGLLLGAHVLLNTVRQGETTVPHQPLNQLSYSLANWTGEERPLQDRLVQLVSVSDYTNRVYIDRADAPVQLYIGYYASQRAGDTIHSPKNCLPGAGWDPIHSEYLAISVGKGRQVVVNEYVIQQDLNKQMVFYWYQSRGRVIASEYWDKLWMVADALSRNRTDGALVRLVTPVTDGEANARARLVKFTQLLFPHLENLIPN